MEPNPYTPGENPRVFVGRETERARFRTRMARVTEYGEMMGPLTVTTGPRGLGKTALLRELETEAQEAGFVTAWVACVKDQPYLGDLLHATTRALRRADRIPPRGRGASLEKVGVELGVGLAKVTATIRPNQNRPLEQATAPGPLIGPLEDFFEEAARLARSHGGSGLLLLLDELHAGHSLDQAVLLNTAQNLAGDKARYPLGIIGAGLPSTIGVLTRAATFGERTREIALDRLDEDTSEDLLRLTARQTADVDWTPRAVHRANQIAQGYPHFLQLIGEEAWEHATPSRGDTIDVADVDAARTAIDAGMRAMFAARWQNTTAGERELVLALANAGGSAARRELAEAMGKKSNDLGPARDSLRDKGVLSGPRGYMAFTVPGFAEFVLEQDDGFSDDR